jgi:hypothetical protein
MVFIEIYFFQCRFFEFRNQLRNFQQYLGFISWLQKCNLFPSILFQPKYSGMNIYEQFWQAED